MNKLHFRYLVWRFKQLGYDTRPSSFHKVIYIQTHKRDFEFATSDYKNLFRRFFIKYTCMYANTHDEMVVRLE